MSSAESRRRRLWRLVGPAPVTVLVLLLLAVTGCGVDTPAPRPEPSTSTPPARLFTVVSTDPIGPVDPAAVTESSSMLVPINVFQRLMSADPGDALLRPDAARDCLYTAATVYTCTLNDELFFHNGKELTSRDVKFSIERARRLAVPGSSAVLLSSIRRIDTPDPKTVQFVLSRYDNQIGWALAAPAASLVDSETYANSVRRAGQPIVGSGPFSVTSASATTLALKRFEKYKGRTPAQSETVTYRTLPDSASIEDAMAKGTVDVAWRGLSGAALTRFSRQIENNPTKATDYGYTLEGLTGTRIRMLQLSQAAIDRLERPVRQAIATALQGDRTLDSIVPGGVTGHVSAFPLGGKAVPKITWAAPIPLSLGYDTTIPEGQDQANQIGTRLEATGGFRVQVRPGAVNTDLTLVDRKAWTATGLAWLQPYLTNPLPQTAALVDTLERRYTSVTSEPEAMRVLGALQRQAAIDLVLLPLTQSDEYIVARQGVVVPVGSFGPGWQLGLFGMRGG
jgi:peptide/nickel transport system substrate-binding protein